MVNALYPEGEDHYCPYMSKEAFCVEAWVWKKALKTLWSKRGESQLLRLIHSPTSDSCQKTCIACVLKFQFLSSVTVFVSFFHKRQAHQRHISENLLINTVIADFLSVCSLNSWKFLWDCLYKHNRLVSHNLCVLRPLGAKILNNCFTASVPKLTPRLIRTKPHPTR